MQALNRSESKRAAILVVYIGVLLLGCGKSNWRAQPATPVAQVEQKSSLAAKRERANAAQGNAAAAIAYTDAVAASFESGDVSADADPVQAMALLDAAAQADPLQAADIEHARGNLQYAQRRYEAAVQTFVANARQRGHAGSATAAVRYYAAAGNREALTSFCDETFELIRGGDDKNVFITECVAGMGYASPAEWSRISGPALAEYERWRATAANKEQQARDARAAEIRARQNEAAAADQAQRDRTNCILRCQEKESICKSNCFHDQCRDDCSDAEWSCRRQC